MTRLYYTDITKVLYMARNFRVEFECIEECVFDGRRVFDFGEYGCEHETIKDFLEALDLPEAYPERIYVKKESESIFGSKQDGRLFFAPEVENKASSIINHLRDEKLI